jgi:hypothetical protein
MFVGLGSGYEKTAAYALPCELLFSDDHEDYVSRLKIVLSNRIVNDKNIFNTIVMMDSLIPFVDTEYMRSLVRKIADQKSPILHVEAYRLALCSRLGVKDIDRQIDAFLLQVSNFSLNEIQSDNAFYGKSGGAAKHEFAYFCLGIITLAYYSDSETAWSFSGQLFEILHKSFIKLKTYILEGVSEEDRAAAGLMSCFLITSYLLRGDFRALNAACYLLEELDSSYGRRRAIPDTRIPVVSYFKAPSWSLAYYSVAKALHYGSLKKFEKELVT